MVYYRPAKWIELSAGFNVAWLASSTGAGELVYTDQSQVGEDAFRGISLDYSYFRDEIGEADIEGTASSANINGSILEIPSTIFAYYDYPEGSETRLYNRFDFGLHASTNFYINGSLYVGVRFNYGLTDITR